MGSLSFITEIHDDEVGLLEAAGYMDARHLSKVEAAVLHQELEKANDLLRLLDVAPSLDRATAWVEAAKREFDGPVARSEPEPEPELEPETSNSRFAA